MNPHYRNVYCVNPAYVQCRGIRCRFFSGFRPLRGRGAVYVGSAGLILLIAEITHQGSLVERWPLKCQNNTVSLFFPSEAGRVCQLTADKEGRESCDRLLLLLFYISSALLPHSPSLSQWFFLVCCLAVFQNGRGCPIHPELSLGEKSECLLLKPPVWDPSYLSLISVSAAGIHGGLGQDALPFSASVLHLSKSLVYQQTCGEQIIQRADTPQCPSTLSYFNYMTWCCRYSFPLIINVYLNLKHMQVSYIQSLLGLQT